MIKFSGLFSIGISSIAVFICSILSFENERSPQTILSDHQTDGSKFHVGTSQRHFGESKNNPPEVKILSPKNNSVHKLNSLIRYSITVSDVEDGESKYDEIPSGKVFLEIKYVESSSDTWDNRKHASNDEPIGLSLMKNSDCFTCHQFKTKLIGPSFQEIATRYLKAPAGKQILVKRIVGGSTGIWGEAIMPAHPDITPEASENIVVWILNNGTNLNLNYLMGKEGALRIERPPGARDGFFVLKASYTDKGLQDKTKENLSGKDVIIIRYK